jgi:hypothetical protein
MALTRLVAGVLREIWEETTPLIGGTSRTLVTGITASAAGQARALALLILHDIASTPSISGTLTIVNGKLAIVVTNSGAVTTSAQYRLDATLLNSTQQTRDFATGVVHVLANGNIIPNAAQIGIDTLASGTVPVFIANAASIAPGMDKASTYTIEASRTLVAASALTIATTALTSRPCDVFITCKALALGFTLSVVNGGIGAGTIGTFAAAMTKPEIMKLRWDGTNFAFDVQDWENP